jgi:hypothetical protein
MLKPVATGGKFQPDRRELRFIGYLIQLAVPQS